MDALNRDSVSVPPSPTKDSNNNNNNNNIQRMTSNTLITPPTSPNKVVNTNLPEGNSTNVTNMSTTSTVISPPILTFSELTRYVKTTTLQIQVTKYLYAQYKGSPEQLTLLTTSTLFGTTSQKKELTERLLVLHNFDLAFQIIQDFQLPIKQIYVNAVSEMSRRRQTTKILELLKNIKGSISDQEWDEVVMTSIEVFYNELADEKTAEKLQERLIDPYTKAKALIVCDKLKPAYLQAVKLRSSQLVKEIQIKAKKSDARAIYDLCTKYLQQSLDFERETRNE